MAVFEPDIASIGALIGHQARAAMLVSLLSGRAHTATELALEADVTAQTASSHLSQLVDGGLLVVRKQGRHKYFQLRDHQVAALLEQLLSLSAIRGKQNIRTGPADPRLRYARVCYDHLAGSLAVEVFNTLVERGWIVSAADVAALTPQGKAHFEKQGFWPNSHQRPTCRACLDWSERRSHLAGELGSWLLEQVLHHGWATRDPDSRIVVFSARGERQFRSLLDPGDARSAVKKIENA